MKNRARVKNKFPERHRLYECGFLIGSKVSWLISSKSSSGVSVNGLYQCVLFLAHAKPRVQLIGEFVFGLCFDVYLAGIISVVDSLMPGGQTI